eukprot:5425245-Pleurochrysis_carterae.AAC.5
MHGTCALHQRLRSASPLMQALARLDSEFRQLCKETRHCEGEISEKHRDEEEGGEAEWMAALLGISNAKRTSMQDLPHTTPLTLVGVCFNGPLTSPRCDSLTCAASVVTNSISAATRAAFF